MQICETTIETVATAWFAPFHTEILQYRVGSPQHRLRLFTLNQALQNRKRRDGTRHYAEVCGVSACKSKNVSAGFSIYKFNYFSYISCRRHYLLPVTCNRGERQQCRTVVWWSDGIRHFTGYHKKKKKKESKCPTRQPTKQCYKAKQQ